MLESKETVVQLLVQLKEKIKNASFAKFWHGFNPYPFAIYNKNEIFLSDRLNQSDQVKTIDGIFIEDWNPRFLGNTAIYFEDQWLAIWDQATISANTTLEELHSSIVHEMYHCYQYERHTARQVNELDFLRYPLVRENIGLRFAERRALYEAVAAKETSLRNKYLHQFVSIRENRRRQIGEYINYELGIESIEGTATYVELKVRHMEYSNSMSELITQYGSDLITIPHDLKRFRASCYSAGLFLCLLLDDFAPNWHIEFDQTKLNLYDFLLQFMSHIDPSAGMEEPIEQDYFIHADDLIRQDRLEKSRTFEAFEGRGEKIIITGNWKLSGLDPMNITCLENQMLHAHFVKVKNENQELYLKGPVLTKHEQDFWRVNEVQYVE